MKLLYSPASPYASKVRMAASHLGLDVLAVRVDTANAPPLLTDNNPLGKIPVLIADDDTAIYDSVAIMHYLGRMKGKRLYPTKPGKRTDAEVLEALADGVCDCLLAIMNEKRSREAEKVHQPYLDKQWGKVVAALDHLERNPPKIGRKLHGGHFALAATLGYLGLRFSGQFEEKHPKLVKWEKRFAKAFPAYGALKPQA